MKRMVMVFTAAAAMILSAAGDAQAQTYKKQVILAASANAIGSQHDVVLQTMKTYIEEKSNGAVTMKIFIGGSMGDETANVKQLRTGELNIATVFTGNLTPFAPPATVLCLPYMFPKLTDTYALLSDQTFTTALADEIANKAQVRPLGWMVGGYRHITNSKHRITKMSDLQGLKIRVSPSAVQLEAFRAWGVEPHPMAWSEVFNALQQGVVDGQENMFATNRETKMWEVQKYMTELHYMRWTGAILAGDRWLRTLDPDTRKLVVDAGRHAQEVIWPWMQNYEDEARKMSIEHGMAIDVLTDEDDWQAKARATWSKFVDTPEMKKLTDMAVAIVEKNHKKD